jgi:predicted MPP superfamily phosphohydrolase
VTIDWTLKRWERVSLAIIGLLAVVVALVLATGYREAIATPVVVRYRVAALAPGSKPLSIALLSDAHVSGFGMSLDAVRLRAIAEQVRELDPDLIVLGGDFTGPGARLEDALTPLSTMAAPLGIVAVLGNHDYDTGRGARDMAAAIRRAGIAPLVNDHVDVGPVVVAGLDDLWKGSSDIGEANRAIADARGRPVVLVSHVPDVFPQVPSGIAVTLAGHTHGAHAVLPLVGPIVSSSRFGQRYRRGEIVERGRTMIVTSGLGGLAFRWNVPPEIALVTLTSKGR